MIRLSLIVAILALPLLSSCSLRTATTNLYSLNTGVAVSPPSASPVSIGVGPIELPNILERPQIVTRKKNNEVEIAELHQWGGRLEEDIGQLIAESLAKQLETAAVFTYPWPRRLSPDYQVSIRFARLDGVPGDSITLSALWELRDLKNNSESIIHRAFIQEPIENHRYTAYVAAISRSIQQLADEIATTLKEAEKDRTTIPTKVNESA